MNQNDIEISSTIKRNQIEDLKSVIGLDIIQKLESVLVNELTKSVNNDIIKKIVNMNLEERKTNAKRRITLGRILDEPPEFFKQK